VDLVRAQPHIDLIRVGGQSSEPALARFAERNRIYSDIDVSCAKEALKMCHDVKLFVQKLPDEFSSILLSKLDLDHQGTDDNDRKMHRTARILAAANLEKALSRAKKLLSLKFLVDEEANKDEFDWRDFKTKVVPLLLATEHPSNNDLADKVIELYHRTSHTAVTLPLLEKSIQHYSPKGVPLPEVLLRWMMGEVPLPQCQFVYEAYEEEGVVYDPCQCENLASHDLSYCSEHQCSFVKEEDESRCTKSVDGFKTLCKYHACAVEDCSEMRFQEPQIYCTAHICYKCMDENSNARASLGKPPRSTCDKHKLCCVTEKGIPCENVVISNQLYCEQHFRSKCKFTFLNGGSCGKPSISLTIPYCQAHKDAARPKPTPVPQAKLTRKRACSATTTRGKPCKGDVVGELDYCRDHMHLANKNTVLQIEQPEFPSKEQETTISTETEVTSSTSPPGTPETTPDTAPVPPEAKHEETTPDTPIVDGDSPENEKGEGM
jgi:hypothetical protein